MRGPVDRHVALGLRVERLGSVVSHYALLTVLAIIGFSKFGPAEARAIVPLVSHSPILSWTYGIWDARSVARAFDAIELATVAPILLRPLSPHAAPPAASAPS